MSKMMIRDLNLVAFCKAKGLKYELVPGDRGRYDFAFENDAELREVLHDFNSGGLISGNSYSESLKQVKTELYSYKLST
jgi:hypothetical protein